MSKEYPQKPGTGTAFPPKTKSNGGPDFKGFLQLPGGQIVGLAIWKKETRTGELLSISIDDREGAYQAKKLSLGQMTMADTQPQNQSAPTRQPGGMSEAARQRQEENEDDQFGFELDDEIPF